MYFFRFWGNKATFLGFGYIFVYIILIFRLEGGNKEGRHFLCGEVGHMAGSCGGT